MTLPPEKRVGITAYRDAIGRFLAQINENTALYSGHLSDPTPISIVRDLHQACTEVLDGKTQSDLASSSHFAKRSSAAGKHMMEHSCGSVILVYDANTV